MTEHKKSLPMEYFLPRPCSKMRLGMLLFLKGVEIEEDMENKALSVLATVKHTF